MPKSLQVFFSLLLLVTCLSCDQVTKQLAVDHLAGEPSAYYLGGTVRMQYAENTGAFLGLGADWPDEVRIGLFVIATGAMLLYATFFLLRYPGQRPLTIVGWLLVIAGGLGNLVDRVRLGYVVDFLNVGVGPVRTGIFNVADVAITFGIAAILIGSRKGQSDRDLTPLTEA